MSADLATTPLRSERDELAEALTHAVHHAKRQFPKVGHPDLPTPWDRAHSFINTLLTDFEAAS